MNRIAGNFVTYPEEDVTLGGCRSISKTSR